MTNVNHIADFTNPFFIHPNENPGSILVPSLLNGENYHQWLRAMKMSLKLKNKLQFVDGTLSKPTSDDPNYMAWNRCNTLVLSWIINSLDPTIAQSVLWTESALEVWNDLRDKYYQGDVFRICELQEEIYSLKQGDLSIAQYFTHMKALWQELRNLRPIPSCTCQVSCNCELGPTIKLHIEDDYVITFLKGLNDKYFVARSQIMLMEPLPNINKRPFHLLIFLSRIT
ncbi:hypothetical protein CR513_57818, partial [Mucuna pruriens]